MRASELPEHKTMTVADLIAELQTFLPNAPVYVRQETHTMAGDFSVIVDGCVTTAPNCGVAIRTTPA